MPKLTIEIPDDKVELVGRAFGVKKGSDESTEDAWKRLKIALVERIKHVVASSRKRELTAETVKSDACDCVILI